MRVMRRWFSAMRGRMGGFAVKERIMDVCLIEEDDDGVIMWKETCDRCGNRPDRLTGCMACGRCLCEDCVILYSDGGMTCSDCAEEDMERYERLMALYWRPDLPERFETILGDLYASSANAAGEDDWQPVLDELEKTFNM